MRVANFKMGFGKQNTYSTAAGENNKFVADVQNKANISGSYKSQLLAQKDRITSNRVPHYNFGRHQVNYQTSMKGQFTSHDLSAAT
jgi:hypothetical protein